LFPLFLLPQALDSTQSRADLESKISARVEQLCTTCGALVTDSQARPRRWNRPRLWWHRRRSVGMAASYYGCSARSIAWNRSSFAQRIHKRVGPKVRELCVTKRIPVSSHWSVTRLLGQLDQSPLSVSSCRSHAGSCIRSRKCQLSPHAPQTTVFPSASVWPPAVRRYSSLSRREVVCWQW
jgi:hypothetical protein